MQVEQFDPVDGSVVLRGQEPGVVGNHDARAPEAGPNLRPVEDCHRGPGIGRTSLPAAGAAVQRGLIGVVLRRTAMRAQHHQSPEPPGQAHGRQSDLGEQHLFVMRHGRGVEHGLRLRSDRVT